MAFVSGSAYGIFFAANAPNADTITVQQAVETLTAEYRDRLETISDTVQHDRQDITANDDVYFIRWQDVLVVFSSYISGDEQGTPVAALTENQVDKLLETMWAMNAVDYSTRAETAVIETTDKNGKATTTEITETVLVIELTHKTPDEMAADYHFTTRQNTYLQLLQDPQYEEQWTELLGGFAQGGGEVMSPDSTRTPTGTLQWSLPVAGTITSQFGHRVDPITGEISSHTGTDITFMNAWNSYLWPKIVFQQNSAITMPMLVANLKSGYTVDYGMLMLGVLICTLPTAIIFLCLQKSFANGITGAVK